MTAVVYKIERTGTSECWRNLGKKLSDEHRAAIRAGLLAYRAAQREAKR